MDPITNNRPIFIKTYSRRMRKVNPWFLPVQRKTAISDLSTSPDKSLQESSKPTKREKKQAGLLSLKTDRKENENHEKNCPPFRKKIVRMTTARKPRSTKRAKILADLVFSSSENEDESIIMKKRCLKTSADECSGVKSVDSPSLGKFVTYRRKPVPAIQIKSSAVVLHQTLNSSDDFVSSTSQNKARMSRCLNKRVFNTHTAHGSMQNRVILAEGSFNESNDQQLKSKCPLLCSTPFVVCKRLKTLPEPPISDISSLSFEEPSQPPVNKLSSRAKKVSLERTDQELWKPHSSYVRGIQKRNDNDGAEKKREGGVRLQREESFECSYEPPKSSLQSLVKELKERCWNEEASVALKTTDIPEYHRSRQRFNKKQKNKFPLATASSSFSLASKPFLITSSSNVQKVENCSKQTLIDRLKSECLLSAPGISIQRLDLALYPSVHAKATKTDLPDSPCTPHKDSTTSSTLYETDNILPNSSVIPKTPINVQTLIQKSSTSAAQSRTRPSIKDCLGAGFGRKVCVSGLGVSRWSKKGTAETNRKRAQGLSKDLYGDYSTCGSTTHAGPITFVGESHCGWLEGTSEIGLPVTPLRMEQFNLSSILANMTLDTLTTHSWGRLKAASSLHKKKTAFPTPRRMTLNPRNPGFDSAMDNSLDLFASSFHTPSRSRAASLLQSISKTPMTSYEEDISDAEKVYQECQQSAPISFCDCILPSRMKHISKIGEGTFGEVFSTINEFNGIVALKIIPVEGSQQVNGEQQKTFGEILHEIIISKELSSLTMKKFNKTNGFIRLNNLHCVRGCYPDALLKAWDNFDRKKGSENDRPDFFDEMQLFLILEFDFGGSDLENMNGKLSSMAQAKSVLHQVTAALAVAEQALCFEHRDLHWGNILVKNVKEQHNTFILNGTEHSIKTGGVHVNIIDYSLSRLEIDGLTVSCDISSDEQLFMGQGDYQFEIYRLMKTENNNCWSEYHPHSNVLWLHYLADKLLSMSYKIKAQSSQQKKLKSSIRSFKAEILNYPSAAEALNKCKFFQ